MITAGQENIKIHFAGAESLIRSHLILTGAKVNYSLFTIFPFLCREFDIATGYQNNKDSYEEVAKINYQNSIHCIQDSGLFSLMFGAYKGDKTKEFIFKWFDALVKKTSEYFEGTVVEVDCQKVLGVEQAWDLRIKLKELLPNNRQINVFHIDDGIKGLDRMIEFSDYIAISVPELRNAGKKNYTQKIAHYIKNKKPLIDIHLLGCTENKLIRDLSFCSSADSTSWTSLCRYGWFKYNNGTKTITIKKSNIDRKHLEEKYYPIVFDLLTSNNLKVTESILHYHSCNLLQIEYFNKQYTYYAGNQD
jgi:hypothetical protein